MDDQRLEQLEILLRTWSRVLFFLLAIVQLMKSKRSQSSPVMSSPRANPQCFFHERGDNPNCKGTAGKRKIADSWLLRHNGSHLVQASGEPICSSCDKYSYDFALTSSPVQKRPALPDPLSPLSPIKKQKSSTETPSITPICQGICAV